MASPSSAPRPSIRVVSRDEGDLAVVVGEIERRYGADYDVRALVRTRCCSRGAAPSSDEWWSCGLGDHYRARHRRRRRVPRPSACDRPAGQACGGGSLGGLRLEQNRGRGTRTGCARPLGAAARVSRRRGVPSVGHRAARGLGGSTKTAVRGGADHRRSVVSSSRRTSRPFESQQRAGGLLRPRYGGGDAT